MLKEVSMDEIQRLTLRMDKFETENKPLKA
jgi:hypothetical protein